MAHLYYNADADLSLVLGRHVAIVGYGNQGHAHALNLRESGCEVQVGARPDGRSWLAAKNDGFRVRTVQEVSDWADLISVLLPDQVHGPVFERSIRSQLASGKLLLTAHGFSIWYGEVQPPDFVDVAMVAPVGPGHMMRRLFEAGLGEPALLAVHQNPSGRAEALALSYAAGLGCTRAGVVRTTFQEETEANLFGEQAVLCGGLSELIKAGFDTLVRAGYQPEVAYFECVHTVKLIADLVYESGVAEMRSRISDTAEFGSYVSGPRVIDDHVREAMSRVLQDVQSGAFAGRWVTDYRSGAHELQRLRDELRDEDLESVGERLRSMMGWLAQQPARRAT